MEPNADSVLDEGRARFDPSSPPTRDVGVRTAVAVGTTGLSAATTTARAVGVGAVVRVRAALCFGMRGLEADRECHGSDHSRADRTERRASVWHRLTHDVRI